MEDINAFIAVWGNGDGSALNSIMAAVYPELRRIARRHLAHRGHGQTLESAALANEVYLKLVRAGRIRCDNRVHFLALCSQMIRRILVDYARARGYLKRGGHSQRVSMDETLLEGQAPGIGILALNDALESLASINARQAHVVDLRYFGGLSIEETAEVLEITPVRVKRDWEIARTWLYGVLTRKHHVES